MPMPRGTDTDGGHMRKAMRAGIATALGTALVLTGCAGGDPTGETADGTAIEQTEATDAKPHRTRRKPRSEGPGFDADAELTLAATQAEPVTGNDAWCGSMQICWDNLIDELNAGNPVVFQDESRNTEEIDHLNAKLFGTGDLSDDHYYTYTGPMTYDAKGEIEKAISDRFGQESDILDQFVGWTDDPEVAGKFLYAMLYRRFSFAVPFSVSEGSGWFGGSVTEGNEASGVAYFEATDDAQREQVTPLYYEDSDNHAVLLATKEGDEVILVKNPQGQTLDEMWQNAMLRADGATGNELAPLGDDERFECPNLDIDLERSYDEWTDSPFTLTDTDGTSTIWIISKALQTLRLHLDNEGGEVKSEAGIALTKSAAPAGNAPRRFVYDDTFAMFVRDGNAGDDAYPYVGILVSDITQFQEGATREE